MNMALVATEQQSTVSLIHSCEIKTGRKRPLLGPLLSHVSVPRFWVDSRNLFVKIRYTVASKSIHYCLNESWRTRKA